MSAATVAPMADQPMIALDQVCKSYGSTPVLRACSYPQSVTFISEECDFLTEADRKAIFAGNFIKYIKQAGGRDLFK